MFICIRTFSDMYMPMAGAGNTNGVNMNGANNAIRAAGYDISTVNNNDKSITIRLHILFIGVSFEFAFLNS